MTRLGRPAPAQDAAMSLIATPSVAPPAAAPTQDASRRFVLLDGLRGICAIAVVIFHTSFLRHTIPDALPSSYLAVDGFFMMSGFVLCHAYHRLLDERHVWTFLRKRWTRLAPVWWVGLALCFCSLVTLKFGPDIANSLGGLAVNTAMLPLPPLFDWRGDTALFWLNPPGWSLFYELVINVAYALVLCRLGVRASLAVMACAAVTLVMTTADLGMTNAGGLWSEAPVALARVTYGFLAGTLLYRLRLRARGGGAIVAPLACAVIVAVFAVDLAGDARWYFDLAMTLVGLPAIVVLGTIVTVPSSLTDVFERIGKASYPLYVLHWPAFALVQQVYGRAVGWSSPVPVAACVALVIVLVALSYQVGVVVDPLAARFGRALDRRAARATRATVDSA